MNLIIFVTALIFAQPSPVIYQGDTLAVLRKKMPIEISQERRRRGRGRR